MSPRQGGDSYPSGTPPYGVPGDAAFSRAGQPPQTGRPNPGSPDRDEPRTETTLTTRIKINIPGSRPIPEVVVRSPLTEEAGEQPSPRRRRADTSGSPVLGVMDSGSRTATPPDLPPEWLTPEESAPADPAAPGSPSSEWFAPRKKSAPPAASAPAPAPSPAPAQPLYQEQPPAAPGYQAPGRQDGRAPAGYDLPYGSGRDATPDPYAQPWATPSPQTQQTPQPQHTQQQPTGPAQGRPAPQAAQARPQQTLPPRPVPGGRSTRLPGAPGTPAEDLTGGQPTLQFRAPTEQLTDPQAGFAQAAGATATMPAFGGPTIATPTPGGPGTGGYPGGPGSQPGQPTAPGGGSRRAGKAGKGGAQAQQPQQGGKNTGKAGAKGGAGNGQTATLPVPRPQPIGDGFAGGTGGVASEPRPEPAGGGQGTGASTAPASGGKRGGGKGRKLAGYAIGALVLAGAGAYGAGLMLNQADIPKGTTVLGYSIGGDTRDQAVTTLTKTLGAIASHPLTVSIGGKTATLNPSVAGLTIDTSATVDSVAHHDYNPVTVIESLFGHGQAVAPVVVIDEDKLRSALQQLASSSSASDAEVHFTATGKVEVTLPKAGSGLDVNAAVPLVEQAFKTRATVGQDTVVTLSVTTVQPKADATAVDEAARTLGAWAMKQQFHVVAGGHPVPFGKGTFSQALTLRPDASGAFVPVFNLAKLKAAYGTAFDGLHTKDGKLVTVQDVAAALVSMLGKPDGVTSTQI
ncbi:hypothetical protein ABH931_001400 [Streptacidiphilus sp. MAP12-33]|uniref:hypothetical protein n=1 Tax=Streptacidiphilus sp. MAP12-33 TaxID=3156266 RepID=UPI003515FF15